MTGEVSVRDVPLPQLDVWHEPNESGRPDCRQSKPRDKSFKTVSKADLHEDVTKCDYCAGEITQVKAASNPDTLAYQLEQADPEEVGS